MQGRRGEERGEGRREGEMIDLLISAGYYIGVGKDMDVSCVLCCEVYCIVIRCERMENNNNVVKNE